MTAMADVGFLLLVFFMVFPHFNQKDVVKVALPQAYGPGQCSLNDMPATIFIKGNKIYIDIADPEIKKQAVKNMARIYRVSITDEEQDRFVKMGTFGASMQSLKMYIHQPHPLLYATNNQGIPINDGRNNELFNWIKETQAVYQHKYGNNMRIGIAADAAESYSIVKLLIANLQSQNINKFSLILNSGKPNVK